MNIDAAGPYGRTDTETETETVPSGSPPLHRPAPADDAGAAPRFQRLTALVVDALLALALTLTVRLLVRLEVLPALGAWRAGEQGAWIDSQVVLWTLVLAALRDVPFGASFAKWLLCMRLTDRAGRPLGLGGRLLRAPASLLPFAWMSGAIQARQTWRVRAYTPTRRGLVVRTAFAAAAAVASVAWGIETVRPSIGRSDAQRLAAATLLADLRLQTELGTPLQLQVRSISPRAHEFLRGEVGKFELRVRGSERQQDMVVVARKVDGDWAIDTIVDIEITALDSETREPVAVR